MRYNGTVLCEGSANGGIAGVANGWAEVVDVWMKCKELGKVAEGST